MDSRDRNGGVVMRQIMAAMVFSLAVCLGAKVPASELNTPGDLMCPSADLWGSQLVTNICWSCLFPIKLMGAVQLGSGTIPPSASNESVCTCSDSLGIPQIGFAVGLWAPARLIEIVRKPYCSPALGGITLQESFRLWGMPDHGDGDSSTNQFYNYHYFAFPLVEMLELLVTPECNAEGYTDFDLMYLSEIDPTWIEDELALFTQPETVVAALLPLQMACPVDCARATAAAPVDSLWWCAGCWGNLYPFTGNVPSGGSPPRVTSLLATRAVASLHRRGLAWKTTGDDALCGGYPYPHLPKTQYKLSMLYPLAEANNAASSTSPSSDLASRRSSCCHHIGVPTMLWGEWRNIPAVGEDYVYLLWRWTDCCVR